MIEIGKYTYGTVGITTAGGLHNIKIGKFCTIATDVIVFVGNNHHTEWVSTFNFGASHCETFPKHHMQDMPKKDGDIIIGNDVWLGQGVRIMSRADDIVIGDGAVIAAHSIVTRSVEPYTIVGGNPAQVIKKRFDDKTIEKLLSLKWWDLPEPIINELTDLLCSSNMEKFFKEAKRLCGK
jgi:acetyltransferase-like isoleucine patch superfamily enzyme